MRVAIMVVAALALLAQRALAQETFIVAPQMVADEKAVFATVESANVVPARARIGGTVVELTVKEGDEVKQGQVVATVGDEKLALQMKSLDAQIAGLEAQVAQAQTDLTRDEDLFRAGTIPKTTLDQARTAFNVASNALKARTAERSVIQQQVTEGNVLAPTVRPRAEGAGDDRHGDPAGRDRRHRGGAEFRAAPARAGAACPLPQGRRSSAHRRRGAGRQAARNSAPSSWSIRRSRTAASSPTPTVAGLGDYFVGERVRVWVSAGERDSVIVPASFIVTRFGIDYARVRKGHEVIDVPVQRGRELPRPDMPDALEILSGLKAGDVLVRP